MDTSKTTTNNLTLRILLLTYGGVALLQWVRAAVLGSAEPSDYMGWLRDGTIALPFVAAAILLASRRKGGSGSASTAVLYAVVMGGLSLLHTVIPSGGHDSHDSGELSNLALLQGTAVIMLISGAYGVVTDRVLRELDNSLSSPLDRLPLPRRWSRALVTLAALLALAPAFVFTGGGRAIAQTSFPDQAIHPRGNLSLIARTLSDGTMAYVAPDFGANGVRPTIEMTEGETLNITLKNELSTDVSLHVHGVKYDQASDGTRHSNSFVRPGQQRVYTWKATSGTAGYWHYHDHVIGDDEGSGGIVGGLYGGLIVRKPGDPKPAKTFVIVGHDKTLNGRIYPDTPTYEARQGELVEWIVISHGNRVHTFHLHAHDWLTPNRTSDPNPSLPANTSSGREDNHILAPGDSFGFLVIAGQDVGPGMWMYHCHFQDHAAAMKGFFRVLPPGPSAQIQTSRTFPETGKTVAGRFLEYWDKNGGLAQQGYPISEAFQEKSDLDGKTYMVQYFERAVFELHPENKPPYDVLLSQLGTFRYKEKYPNGR